MLIWVQYMKLRKTWSERTLVWCIYCIWYYSPTLLKDNLTVRNFAMPWFAYLKVRDCFIMATGSAFFAFSRSRAKRPATRSEGTHRDQMCGTKLNKFRHGQSQTSYDSTLITGLCLNSINSNSFWRVALNVGCSDWVLFSITTTYFKQKKSIFSNIEVIR